MGAVSDSYQSVVTLISHIETEERVQIFDAVMEECGVLPLERLYASHNLKVGLELEVPKAVLLKYEENPESVKKMFTLRIGEERMEEVEEDGYINPVHDLANTINIACRENQATSKYLAFLMAEVDSSFHLFLIGKMDKLEPFNLDSYQDMKFVDDHNQEITDATHAMLAFLDNEQTKIQMARDGLGSCSDSMQEV